MKGKSPVMEPIAWIEGFSVGVALFDEQHRRLIDMLNRLIRDPDATTNSETVSDLLTDLTRYAQEHFNAEEDRMTEYGYPALEEHRRQHDAFREKVARLCVATVEGEASVPQDLLAYLQRWLIRHILQADMAFKPFFEQQGVQ